MAHPLPTIGQGAAATAQLRRLRAALRAPRYATVIKGAEDALWGPTRHAVTAFLLNVSAAIVQDQTGLRPSDFAADASPPPWRTRAYGNLSATASPPRATARHPCRTTPLYSVAAPTAHKCHAACVQHTGRSLRLLGHPASLGHQSLEQSREPNDTSGGAAERARRAVCDLRRAAQRAAFQVGLCAHCSSPSQLVSST